MSRFSRIVITMVVAAVVTGPGCSSPDTSQDAGAPNQTVSKSQLQRPPSSPPRSTVKRPKNTSRVSARELVRELASAGLESQDLGLPSIDLDDSSRFPEEPRSALWLKLSDGKGNASPMTFVEFSSWKAAAELDAKPVNGFAVRNWFVLGTTNNYFVKRVTEALDS